MIEARFRHGFVRDIMFGGKHVENLRHAAHHRRGKRLRDVLM
jgi:hypothetical protein